MTKNGPGVAGVKARRSGSLPTTPGPKRVCSRTETARRSGSAAAYAASKPTVRTVSPVDSEPTGSAAVSADSAALLPARTSSLITVSYTHLRAHETRHDLVCRLLLE